MFELPVCWLRCVCVRSQSRRAFVVHSACYFWGGARSLFTLSPSSSSSPSPFHSLSSPSLRHSPLPSLLCPCRRPDAVLCVLSASVQRWTACGLPYVVCLLVCGFVGCDRSLSPQCLFSRYGLAWPMCETLWWCALVSLWLVPRAAVLRAVTSSVGRYCGVGVDGWLFVLCWAALSAVCTRMDVGARPGRSPQLTQLLLLLLPPSSPPSPLLPCRCAVSLPLL